MAGDDAAVHHLVNPIARLRDRWIVRDEKERHLLLLDDGLQKRKRAL